jgi:hypothetical protein
MKRYTGQKALYEAISRSRAKARRGNILERFLPEVTRQERPPGPEGPPSAKPTEVPVEPPVVKEPPRPVLERLREAVAAREKAKLRRLEKPDKAELPPTVKPRAVEKDDQPAPPSRTPLWWQLKPLQFNEGRIEISVSYHVGIAVALAVILVILAGFRLGQRFPAAKAAGQTKAPANATAETAAEKTLPTGTQGAASPTDEPAQSPGDNWIILAVCKNRADLEPVKEHFAKNGIALEICPLESFRQWLSQNGLTAAVPSGDGFMLVTSSAYHNPGNPDTDGYRMKQRIAAVGATYKAQKGRDPFTPNLFKDAYGMKISKVK